MVSLEFSLTTLPLLTKIKPGTLKFHAKDESEETLFFVAGGFLEVQPTVVTVLADTVVRGEEIDQARAEEAKRNCRRGNFKGPRRQNSFSYCAS